MTSITATFESNAIKSKICLFPMTFTSMIYDTRLHLELSSDRGSRISAWDYASSLRWLSPFIQITEKCFTTTNRWQVCIFHAVKQPWRVSMNRLFRQASHFTFSMTVNMLPNLQPILPTNQPWSSSLKPSDRQPPYLCAYSPLDVV